MWNDGIFWGSGVEPRDRQRFAGGDDQHGHEIRIRPAASGFQEVQSAQAALAGADSERTKAVPLSIFIDRMPYEVLQQAVSVDVVSKRGDVLGGLLPHVAG
ncbi:TPA: hypothetical protein QDA95_002016 [Burkholderia vietnamiensis]|nr:hypothetical protein [Burkholderia vietnamiensis]